MDDFYKKYCQLRLKLAPFRTKAGFEYLKTVAQADGLSIRAYNIHNGSDARSMFGPATADFSEAALMDRAFELAESLERGEFPLSGKFCEPGGSLIDHSFIREGDVMHVFYNRGTIGYLWDQVFVDSIGHATSRDLVHWEIQKPALAAQAGGHDDYQVWSPGVIRAGGKYLMYYTGVNINIAQAACIAESDDLYNWTRYPGNPVYTPGDWCSWSADKWSDCRDNMVFQDDDGKFYMYSCSSNSTGPVVSLAVSEDAYHWKDLGPISIAGVPKYEESPFVMKKDGRYYMFFTNVGIGTCYAVSDDPVKGWYAPEGNFLLPTCCSEVFEFGGKWYISAATYMGRGEQYLEIAELFWNVDGSVRLGRFLR